MFQQVKFIEIEAILTMLHGTYKKKFATETPNEKLSRKMRLLVQGAIPETFVYHQTLVLHLHNQKNF